MYISEEFVDFLDAGEAVLPEARARERTCKFNLIVKEVPSAKTLLSSEIEYGTKGSAID
jgi:hypothetical protein